MQSRSGELAFYRASAATDVALAAIVAVAGTCWRVEESFQSSKKLAGLNKEGRELAR